MVARDYADPHLQILTVQAGPFVDCDATEDRRKPTTPRSPSRKERQLGARLVVVFGKARMGGHPRSARGTEFAPTDDVDDRHRVRSSQPRDPITMWGRSVNASATLRQPGAQIWPIAITSCPSPIPYGRLAGGDLVP